MSPTSQDRLAHECALWQKGLEFVAGVVEAGRGPLAGPVFAAAVVLPCAWAETGVDPRLRGLNDSKQLTARRRDAFFALLSGDPRIRIGVGRADVAEIDRINILRATHPAMARALAALPAPPDLALVDGLPVPGLGVSSRAVVQGDAQSLLIAAASVIAKVTRDRLMLELEERYPGYGFARHKGYGTALHLDALRQLGPCPEHRRSFAPVARAEEHYRLRGPRVSSD